MKRTGMGALIPLIAVVLGGLFVFLAAGHFSASNAALSTMRTYDLRAAIEAGRTAISAVMPIVKQKIASNAPYPGTGKGWRDLFTPPFSNHDKYPPTLIALPRSLKEHFEGQDVEVTDVRVGVAEWFEPSYRGVTSFNALQYPPQGTIGVAVNASVQRGKSRVTRLIVQRWVFYITQKSGAVSRNIGNDIIVNFEPRAQCTMVLQ